MNGPDDAARERAVTQILNIYAGKSRLQARREAEQMIEAIAEALIAEGLMI